MRRKTIAVAAGIALVALGIAAATRSLMRPPDGDTVAVSHGEIELRIEGPGTVQARVPVAVSARIAAQVVSLHADHGDRVKRGQLLAVLDDRDLAAKRAAAAAAGETVKRNIEAAQASLAKAQTDLELARNRQRRDLELYRSSFISESAYETSSLGLQAAQASARNAQAQREARESEARSVAADARYADILWSHTRIAAPLDALVIQRAVEVGSTVAPGVIVFRLVDPATLWVAARIDESLVGKLAEGMAARVRLRSGEEFAGRVARISRQSDAATRELEVFVSFDAPPERFAIDQEAQVSILAGAAKGLLVPVAALVRVQGRQGVMIMRDGRKEFQPVRVAASDGEHAVIAAGLDDGVRLGSMDLALKDIRRQLGKFFATAGGVGMLLAIVLVMNGIYQGNISDGVWLIENAEADLWVVEQGRGGPFNESSRLAGDAYKSVAAVPGVARASPFIAYAAQREVAGANQQFTIIGYDIVGGLGGPRRLTAGRAIEAAHWEMVADAKLGLVRGERVRLGAHDYTVVGLTRGAVDAGGNPLVYISLPDAQEVLYQQDSDALVATRAANLARIARAGYPPDESTRILALVSGATTTVNAVLVQLAKDAEIERTRGHIERWLHLSAYTAVEQRELMLEGRLKKMSAVLGLFRALLVIVSLVIISLIVYVLTIEKIRAIATLKLIGAPNRVIVRMIMEQSLALTLGSFAIAYALMSLVRDRFPRTLVLLPEEMLVTFAVILAGGVLASGMAIWHAMRVPPALALGG